MHYEIETASALLRIFPELDTFSAGAQRHIFSDLQERYEDKAITADDVRGYAEHESIPQLADYHNLDYDDALKNAYKDNYPNTELDGFDELDEVPEFDELTDEQKREAADEYSADLITYLEKQGEHDGLIIFELPFSWLTYDPSR